MKTKLLSLTIGLMLCGILSFGGGLEIKFYEEQYIDNIPINASTAFDNYFRDSLFIQECSLKNEQLSDDSISNIKKNKKSESDNLIIINLEEEEYIDDIPFDTKQVFRQNITYPEFARKMKIEGVVFVCFTYNEDGYIEIICTNSSHEEFNEYIIEQLSNTRLRNGSVKIGKEYFAKFVFKIL